MQADRAALQQLVDAELNATGCGFHVVLPVVLVTYVAIERSWSLSAPPERRGYFQENDLMVWLLVARLGGAGEFVELGWYVPLVWVDHPIAVIEGREGMGYPKALATVAIAGPAGPFHTSTFVFPGDSAVEVQMAPINAVVHADVLAAERDVLASLREVWDHLLDNALDAADNAGVLAALLPSQILLLRELAAGTDPDRRRCSRCGQPVHDLSFHSADLLLRGPWTVEFPGRRRGAYRRLSRR